MARTAAAAIAAAAVSIVYLCNQQVWALPAPDSSPHRYRRDVGDELDSVTRSPSFRLLLPSSSEDVDWLGMGSGGFDPFGFRFRGRRQGEEEDLAGLIQRQLSSPSLGPDERYKLESFLRYLLDALQESQQVSPLLAGAPGAMSSRIKKGEEFLRIRPQRENRRYLLWRKITGKK